MPRISLPITLANLQDDGFHLLVEIVVFKQKLFAVLDTGASRSVFDEHFIREHITELDNANDSQATTLFSTTNTFQAIIPKIKLGRLLLTDYNTVALDLQGVNQAYKELGLPPVVAIIGSDLLLKYGGIINYAKMKLYLNKPL